MISGRVIAGPEAVITLQIQGPAGHETAIEAVIDTGFTDYLTLPRSVIDMLQLPTLDTSDCQLADGRVVTMEGFIVTVRWHDALREVVALSAEGGPLIGMSLLHNSRLTIDVIVDGAVVIDPVA